MIKPVITLQILLDRKQGVINEISLGIDIARQVFSHRRIFFL